MKPFYRSRTFYAVVLTGAVIVGRALVHQGELPAAWDPALQFAQMALEAAGLWFIRLGIGTPIAPVSGPKED